MQYYKITAAETLLLLEIVNQLLSQSPSGHSTHD